MDEKTKNLKPLSNTADQILTLYRKLSPKQKAEFMTLGRELSLATPEENSAGQELTAQRDV